MKITYAIGDIHGQVGPLKILIEKVLEYHFSRYERFAEVKFVFLGDYVDRGPDSRGVIDYLITLSLTHECVFLRGNHEDMLLNDHSNFLRNGGLMTLKSYGWKESDELSIKIIDDYLKDHLPWYQKTELYHTDGLRTYVHAGISRARPMSQQDEAVMLWVREPFLRDTSEDGGYVVHGHTPMENGVRPAEHHNRINLDTGSVFNGRLSCAVFGEEHVRPIDILQDMDDVDVEEWVKTGSGLVVPSV